MKKHPADVIALVFGLAFAMVGGAFVTHELAGGLIDPAWLAAIGLVVIGVVALAATFLRPETEPEPALEAATVEAAPLPVEAEPDGPELPSGTREAVFVCVDTDVVEIANAARAVDTALRCAAEHSRVGIDLHADGARRAAARALPGMVVCPREFAGVACCPLTTTTSLVTARL